jgi:O-antigen/teichoic acid export membrane protein
MARKEATVLGAEHRRHAAERLRKSLHRVVRGWIGAGVGERTDALLQGLGWNLPAALVSRLFAGVATLLAARSLGPGEFGEANLALAASLWVQVPLFLGIPAALMHHIPRAAEDERQAWSAAGLWLALPAASATLAVGFGWPRIWAQLHGVRENVWILAVVWCAGFWIYTVCTSLAAAQERFRLRAAVEICFAVAFPSIIAVLWLADRLHAESYVLSFAVAYAIAGSVAVPACWPRRIRGKGIAVRCGRLLRYGLLASLGGVAHALLQSMGRLIANRHLSIDEVGILSAYHGASLQTALYFLTFASQIFFPIASRTPDRDALFVKISRIGMRGVPLCAAACACVVVLYVALLGAHYPLRLLEVIVFSVASGLAIFQGILNWYFASAGFRGLAVAVALSLLIGAVNVAAALWCIPRWSTAGAGAALAAAYAAGIVASHVPAIRRWGT